MGEQRRGSDFEHKLEQVSARHAELARRLAREAAAGGDLYARLSREYAGLAPVIAAIDELRRARAEIADLEGLTGAEDTEPEMRTLAEEELRTCRHRLKELERRVRLMLVPRDEADARSVILEIRAGTGGEEAALFAGDLLRMYQRYAERRGWAFEILQLSETGLGGVKEAIAAIKGDGAYARLKFESGVHRVQRVPQTEAGGRIHTSAATVAVLPEPEDVDVKIDEKDLRIDVFRASGPGGQSVNTTDSAVRITHLPSGIVVSQQDEKSQHKNKAKALKILRARLYERERALRDAARAAERRHQVGSGDRSERIRTYNFPQGRVSEHRINLTLYRLDSVLAGEALDEIIEALIADDEATRLAASA